MSAPILEINPKRLARRRLVVFGLMFLSTAMAAIKWIMVVPTDVSIVVQTLMIVLFILTFAWVSLFFWSNVFGFFELLRSKKTPDISGVSGHAELFSKTAILAPVYNESSRDVFANLLAMANDLKRLDREKFFDIFVLSDTTDPKVWVEEERVWLEAKKIISPNINLYYRRRSKNVARKSGNIEDFCKRFGSIYDFMIVLDADSLIEGETMVKMVQLMEANAKTGIIQAPPVCINRNTLFARLQQFASKIYGPIIASGLGYLQGGDSNYWGHNAIIRVKAFIECCGLPELKGTPPFGGPILSHDFVEAALIRRGGWNAWLLPDLKGSYEESPPTIIDYASRDRRWCQGEMQHIKLLTAKDFHPISRLHFLVGVMSYLSSPLWLCFLLTGLTITLGREIFPPAYFPENRTLFPEWPIFDRIGTIYLFIASMTMLILPKFFGLIIYIKNHAKGKFSAIKSVFAEILVSALFAPIMMMFQSKFVFDVFMGKAVGWNTQNRGDLGTSLKDAVSRHFWHTVLGVITSIVVWFYADSLFWWMSPVTLGLILSIPISIVTSKASVGIFLKKCGFFTIPEEIDEPDILLSSKHFLDILEQIVVEKRGVELIVNDSVLNALHIFMISVNGPIPNLDRNVLKNAEIKLENYINHQVELGLSKDEEIALLYSPELLENANVMMKMR